jgi:hypothetical protein
MMGALLFVGSLMPSRGARDFNLAMLIRGVPV